jgi:hypothetical protein
MRVDLAHRPVTFVVIDQSPLADVFFTEPAIPPACRIGFSEKVYRQNRLCITPLAWARPAVEEDESIARSHSM